VEKPPNKMAAQNKTTENEVSVADFLDSFVQSDTQKQDSLRLIEMMTLWSGYPPKMWGPSIIGFGKYHYRYTSRREGDSPLLAFSPRKDRFSLYVTVSGYDYLDLLNTLGKFSMGKSCIYFKKLSDLHPDSLEKICRETLKYIQENPETPPC
jgi:hypothetical protein